MNANSSFLVWPLVRQHSQLPLDHDVERAFAAAKSPSLRHFARRVLPFPALAAAAIYELIAQPSPPRGGPSLAPSFAATALSYPW